MAYVAVDLLGPSPVLRRERSNRPRVVREHSTDVPTVLMGLDRWIRHSAKKVPLSAWGTVAKSNDPETWTTFADAEASEVGSGLGFVLNGDGIVCLDIDHCLEDGEVAPWARALVESLPATWIEVSPSGDGLHVWGTGAIRSRVAKVQGGRVEIYGSGRYLTVTGRRFRDAPLSLADLSGVIETL